GHGRRDRRGAGPVLGLAPRRPVRLADARPPRHRRPGPWLQRTRRRRLRPLPRAARLAPRPDRSPSLRVKHRGAGATAHPQPTPLAASAAATTRPLSNVTTGCHRAERQAAPRGEISALSVLDTPRALS